MAKYTFFTSQDDINVIFVKNLNFLFIINNFEACFCFMTYMIAHDVIIMMTLHIMPDMNVSPDLDPSSLTL